LHVFWTKNLLKKTGTRIPDYDFMEINTAFGSQILINKMELGLDMDRVNCFGDCIALGHPVGAAGARLMTTLLYALKRCGKRLGLVSICLGGGNAIAMAVERLNQ
jgi:acetyl-CoA C-acetyltransferase